MKVLITGSQGFVGKYLIEEFRNVGYEVIPCGRNNAYGCVVMDISDAQQVQDAIYTYQPDIIVNLAGQANVGLSWKQPQQTVSLNVIGLLNILEAVREIKPQTKIIAVGSSDQYGSLGELGVNVTEETPLMPMTPYAVSKLAQENMCKAYIKAYKMNICMVRCFNIAGPGQKKGFMISDFASGIAEIEAGQKEALYVGNLESGRDFTHVKDAARAYRYIAEKGHSGEVYNICSGRTYTAREILERLLSMSLKPIKVEQDPARMRPSDTPVIRGNHDKLTSHTGWKPKFEIEDILEDTLSFWRDQFK